MKVINNTISRRKRNEILTAYFFLLPILVLIIIWFYYPVSKALVYSFTDMNFLRPDNAQFIGFENYVKLLTDPLFLKSLKNTMIITVFAVPIEAILALVLAVSLNKMGKGKAVFRTIYYLPYVTSTVAVTTVLMYLFVKNGIITDVMSIFGFRNTSWFADVKYALPFLTIIIIWTYVGFYIVIYLASLQSIPDDIYAAASIDGANFVQKFLKITVPILKPTHYLVFTSGFIFTTQVFDHPFVMARSATLGTPAGETSTAIIFFYKEAFINNNSGYASAAAFIVFLIILIVSVVQRLYFEREA